MPRLDDADYEYKSEGKYDDRENSKQADVGDDDEFLLPGMGQAEDDTLLVRVARFCSSAEFTTAMDDFIGRNIHAWGHADLLGTGEGSSHEELQEWKRIHEEYMDVFEEKLERFVSHEGGDLPELMEDCREAMEQKHAWLFEDENYALFVTWMKSVLDFEDFHSMMITKARATTQGRSHK